MIRYLCEMETEIIKKVCFRCGIEQPLSEFYKHKQMGDGHLNKCKTCTKEDTKSREVELRNSDPEWVEAEKVRAREKYYRLGYKDEHKPTAEKKKIIIENYKAKYPEKQLAKNATQHLKIEILGNQLHHWSYNEEHFKDAIELSVREHKKLHRYIFYDQERKMYRRVDNNMLLDTRESHIDFYNSLVDKP